MLVIWVLLFSVASANVVVSEPVAFAVFAHVCAPSPPSAAVPAYSGPWISAKLSEGSVKVTMSASRKATSAIVVLLMRQIELDRSNPLAHSVCSAPYMLLPPWSLNTGAGRSLAWSPILS